MPAEEQGHGFRIAQMEKALLDTLYKIRGIRTKQGIFDLIIEDLRINEELLRTLNWDTLQELAPYYRSTTIKSFIQYGREI